MEALTVEDPRVVGGYTLRGRLGTGGMGVVYLGESPGGRLVAVKIVHRHLAADARFRHRFTHEIAALRQVGGIHTAQVIDAAPDADPPWVITAYITGPSLAKAITASGPLSEPQLRKLGAGLAEALAAIHGAGIMHRDLKPSNVLLAHDGPRVIDFGIAQALDATAITGTHTVIGTPGFIAPEQITGGQITPACDIYSLGRVLCFAAGATPFGDGDAQAPLHRALHHQPDLHAVPPGIRPVIAACLAVDPAARPTPAQLLEQFNAHSSATQDPWLSPPLRTMLAESTHEIMAQRTTQTAGRGAPAATPYADHPAAPGMTAIEYGADPLQGEPAATTFYPPYVLDQHTPPPKRRATVMFALASVTAGVVIAVVVALALSARHPSTPNKPASVATSYGPPVNLALDKQVTVSSQNAAPHYGWDPTDATDGNTAPATVDPTTGAGAQNMGWASAQDPGAASTEWIEVDLGSEHPVDEVDLYPRNDTLDPGACFPTDFTISVSSNGSTWVNVASETNYPSPGTSPQRFAFSTTTARYVRVTATGLTHDGFGQYHFELKQIEVFNP